MKLCFPESILSQHLVVLGKTGAGKSSALRHVVEHLLDHKKRVCVVDPKGDWWGLKFAANGQDEGYPVIAFGNFKEDRAADIPMNDHAGKAVAELVATGNRPCILGFRGWMPGAMTRFWIDFSSTLFNSNAGELYLVIDEVHNFAAKGKIMDPEAGKCLHWTNRLMSEGRGVGIVGMIASQRPQKVHNDTLTCCETLVAMRVIHKADRQAVKDWIDGCGDGSSGNDVLNNVAQLERGEAYVWSPENEFGPTQLKFSMFETFDSFAPPQLQKKVSDRGWGTTDLDAVKSKLAGVIKEAEANDPKLLRQEIRRLEAEVAKRLSASPSIAAPDKKQAALADRQIANLKNLLGDAMKIIATINAVNFKGSSLTPEQIAEALNGAVVQLGKQAERKIADTAKGLESLQKEAQRVLSKIERDLEGKIDISVSVAHNEPFSVTTRPVPLARPPSGSGNGELNPGQQKILDTIAMLKVRGVIPSRDSVARWHRVSNRNGLHPTGGTYGQNLAALRAEGYLENCDLTDKARAAAREIDSGFDAACMTVDAGQERILRVLREHPAKSFTRDTMAEALDLHPTGGTYGQNLARLRVMQLIPERGEITLCETAER